MNEPPLPHLTGEKHDPKPSLRPVPFQVWASLVSGCFFLGASAVGVFLQGKSLISTGFSIWLGVLMIFVGVLGLILRDVTWKEGK